MKSSLFNRGLAILSAVILVAVIAGPPVRRADAQVQCTTIWPDFVEVTQAIQKQSSTGTVPLIDGRRTGVRVFLQGLPVGCQGPSVQVKLTSIPSDHLGNPTLDRPAVMGWSEGGLKDVKSSYDRSVENDSFNFQFNPAGWEGHFHKFKTEIFVNGSLTPLRTDSTSPKYFNKMCPPDIAGVRVSQPGLNPPFNLPPEVDGVIPGIADSLIWAVNPFPEYNSGFNHGGGYRLEEEVLEVHGINGAPPVDQNVWTTLALKSTKMDPQPDFLIGWLKVNPSDVESSISGEALIRGSTSWNRVNNGSLSHVGVATHELGHSFGYEHHSYGLTIDEVGWDVWRVFNPGRVKPTASIEYMFTGNTTTWTGPEAYVDTFNNSRVNGCIRSNRISVTIPIIPPPNPPPWPPPWPPSGWSIGRAVNMGSVGQPVTTGGTGHVKVELLDSVGAILSSKQLDPVSVCEDGGTCSFEAESTSVQLPWNSNAHSIKLYVDNVLQDTRTKSANAPVVSLTSPLTGASLSASTMIQWTATDADNDVLQTDVHYSHDGTRWVLLASELSGSSLTLVPGTLPASSNATIRVTVSDGFNTTQQTVGQLSLSPNQPPQAYIQSPRDGLQIKAGAIVVLLGTARDPEAGTLSTGQMSWSSSLDGALGYGDLLNIGSLSVGTHTLMFNVTDAASASASDSVIVTVLSW